MAIGNPINLTSNVEGKNISVIATAGQTQFTVTGGYRINQISVFRNGVRLVDGRDYTALDGSIVTLLSAATVADVLEFQVFDDFRVSDALNVNSGGTVNGNVTVTGILSTTNLSIGTSISLDSPSGIVTAVQFIGQMTGTASTATEAEGLTGVPDITVNNIVAAAATFSGVVTYEDITNIDSIGIVTARTGVDITANGLVVNAGVSTFGADLSIADKIVHTGDANTAIRFPSNDKFTVETAGVQRLEVDSTGDLGLVGIATATGLVVVAGSGGYAGHTGIITAVTFDGALSGAATQVTVADESSDTTCFPLFATAATGDLAPKSGTNLTFNSSSGALTATSFAGNISGGTVAGSTGTFTGDVDIADKIVHTGDTNTAIRFPAADTFTVETGGSERLRVTSAGDVGIGTDIPSSYDSGARTLVLDESGTLAGMSIRSSSQGAVYFADGLSGNEAYRGRIEYDHSDDMIQFGTSGTGSLVNIDSSGRLLVGTTSNDTGDLVQIKNSAGEGIGFYRNSSANDIVNGRLQFHSSIDITSSIEGGHDGSQSAGSSPGRLVFKTTASSATSPTERLRIDSSGRLLIGATSSAGNAILTVQGLAGNTTEQGILAIRRSINNGTNAKIGVIEFSGGDNNQAAIIQAVGDNTWGTDDYPGRLEFHTTADSANSPTERLRITSAGNVSIQNDSGKFTAGAGDDLLLYHDGSQSYIAGDDIRITNKAVSETMAKFLADGTVELNHNDSKKFETTSSGITVTGTVSDSIGPLRRLGIQAATSSFTLAADHAGKLVRINSNSQTITLPQNIFTAGDMISIFNVSTGDTTIAQGTGVTLHNSADASTGNRTLAAKGICTIVCSASNEFVISGSNLS